MFKKRILYMAILVSACLHLFWMSVITVVVAPRDIKERSGFSKIYFLGPLLERTHLELRVQRKEPTLLEKKYLEEIIDMADIKYLVEKQPLKNPFFISTDEVLVQAIKKVCGGQKYRPEFIYQKRSKILR